MANRLTMLAVLALVGFLLTACPEPAHDEIVDVTTAPGMTQPAPTATTSTSEQAAGGGVQVRLSEYRIEMPATLPAGPTTFEITNVGEEEHNFEIEGQGIEMELPENLTAGASGTLQVDLQPGTYEIYCPVGEHEDHGMTMQLTVTEPSTTTSTTL